MTFRTIHLFLATAVIAALLAVGCYLYNGAAHKQRLVAELEGQGWELAFHWTHPPEDRGERTLWYHLWNDPTWATSPEGSEDGPVRRPELAQVCSLTSVQHLRLDGTLLDAAEVEALERLPALHTLDLRRCELSHECFASLPRLRQLAELDLRYVATGREDWQSLSRCSLKQLHLFDANCDDAALATLARSPTLQALWIEPQDMDAGELAITAEGLDALHQASALSEFTLYNLRITPEMSRSLRGWSRLTSLSLLDCRASAVTMQTLRAAHFAVWTGTTSQAFGVGDPGVERGDLPLAHVISPNPIAPSQR